MLLKQTTLSLCLYQLRSITNHQQKVKKTRNSRDNPTMDYHSQTMGNGNSPAAPCYWNEMSGLLLHGVPIGPFTELPSTKQSHYISHWNYSNSCVDLTNYHIFLMEAPLLMSTYNHLFSSSQQLYPNRCRKCVHCLADLSAQVNVFQVNSLSAVQNKTFKKGFHEINCGVHQKNYMSLHQK